MESGEALFPRHARRAVTAALADTRVVVINGARQAGKSTLARLVMSRYPRSELRYLDEAPLRDAAQADPGRFVRHDGLLVIDEVQMIVDPSRGANLEFLLTLIRARRWLGSEPQIIALSAVIGVSTKTVAL